MVQTYLCDAEHVLRPPSHLLARCDPIDRLRSVGHPLPERLEALAHPRTAHIAIALLRVFQRGLDSRRGRMRRMRRGERKRTEERDERPERDEEVCGEGHRGELGAAGRHTRRALRDELRVEQDELLRAALYETGLPPPPAC